MIFRDFMPSPELGAFVEVYHLRHFIFPAGTPIPVKPYPPRPEHCLAFYVRGFEITEHLKDAKRVQRPRSVVSGQYTYQINRHSSPEFLMILVVFKPGALYRLTGIPLPYFTNTEIDAEAVFPKELRSVNKRLSGSDSYSEMIRIVDDFLCGLFRNTRKEVQPVDRALEQFLKQDNGFSVHQLARDSFLSPRQLERKVRERTGVSPKTFLRIARFNLSYFLHLKHSELAWSSIAFHCGYTDYQHLAKDYKEFTGNTANRVFLEEEKAPERVLGLVK